MKEFSTNTSLKFKTEDLTFSGKSDMNIIVPSSALKDTSIGRQRLEKDKRQDTGKREKLTKDSDGNEIQTQEEKDADQIEKALQRSFVMDETTGRFSQRLTCLICKKAFDRLCNAKCHVRIHFNDRPYECKVCGKTFTQKGNL